MHILYCSPVLNTFEILQCLDELHVFYFKDWDEKQFSCLIILVTSYTSALEIFATINSSSSARYNSYKKLNNNSKSALFRQLNEVTFIFSEKQIEQKLQDLSGFCKKPSTPEGFKRSWKLLNNLNNKSFWTAQTVRIMQLKKTKTW